MDLQGTFAADLILASPRAYAVGAVARHERLRPGLTEGYSRYGFADLTYDTQVRLEYLCEALAAGRAELFCDHVGWLKTTLAAKGAPDDFIRQSLKCLVDELRECLPPQAGAMAGDYLEEGIAHLQQCPGEIPSLLEGDAPHVDLTRKYLLAVLENREDDAVRLVLEALDEGVPLEDLHDAVLVRSQEEIGRMWQVGEVTVAEEHYSSRIAERVIIELNAKMPRAELLGRRVICTSVGGNMHDLGIRLVSSHFDLAGWNSILLGANMPMTDLVRSLLDFRADMLALSASLVLHVRSTAELIQGVRSIEACANVPIIVGGMPFRIVPELWKIVGADGRADDARQAVETGARLLGQE